MSPLAQRSSTSLFLIGALAIGCSAPYEASVEETPAPAASEFSAPGGRSTTTQSAAGADLCGNGLDDDSNGIVDDGCACTPGATQPCFAGNPKLAGVGACTKGTQTCIASGVGEARTTTWGTCVGSVGPTSETCNLRDDDCNGAIDDAPACGGPSPSTPGSPNPTPGPGANPTPPPPPGLACSGVGLIFQSVGNDCIDDGGNSGEDDNLQVYCVNNIARFCLSHEACPWRTGQVTPDTVTCSTAGLNSNYFVSARGACGTWQGNARICCSPTGQTSFKGC